MKNNFQVHVLVRTNITGLSVWKAVRPAGSECPYLFSREDAEKYVRVHGLQSGEPDHYKVVEV